MVEFKSSCEKDFLEQDSPDQLTTENFWENESDALSGLSAVYSQLNHFIGWDNYIEARSVREYYRSDYVKPGADAYNYAWWMELYNFSFTSGNYAIELLWRDDYRGINYANQVIENVGKMTEEQIESDKKEEIIAEARFLRAWYYFDLIKNFENLVLRKKVPVSDADIPKGFSERSEVWQFIIDDLKAAEPVLPKRSERPSAELGRATKGAARAYLGKVFLYRAAETGQADDYVKAATWLQKVVDTHEYALEENFLGMFNGTISNSSESVFELQQAATTANGAYYKSMLNAWVAASELGGYGEIYGTDALLSEMTSEGKNAQDGRYDHRVYQTVYFDSDYFNSLTGRVYGKTYDEVFGANANTIAFRKWIPADRDLIPLDNAINMPLMRYSDVLLMLAEALNKQNDPSAIQYVNLVRTKHGKMPALSGVNSTQLFEQIQHERVMEFTLEGSRFFDLKRWGQLEEAMNAANRNFSIEKAYFPTPQDEVHYNPEI